jgi:hypothetical protein
MQVVTTFFTTVENKRVLLTQSIGCVSTKYGMAGTPQIHKIEELADVSIGAWTRLSTEEGIKFMDRRGQKIPVSVQLAELEGINN